MSINLIDKKIYDAPKVRDQIRLASEDPVEEFELFELPILIKEFKNWQENNPGGSWSDFYKIYLGGLTSERNVIEEPTIKVAELPKSKINEILKIKEIDLTPEFLKLIDTFSKLSSSERDSIAWMLKRTFNRKK